jgi:hypothetical protein
MTGPHDRAASDDDRLRAGHADREQAIDVLKAAFVHGRLTKAEFDTRAGQALSARTYADLSGLTADIPAAPVGPAVPVPARTRAPARRRPLAKAAAGSGLCLVIADAARWAVGHFDPGGIGPNPEHYLAPPFILLFFVAVFAALGILVTGVAASVKQRRSRRRPPPRPRPGSCALGDAPPPRLPRMRGRLAGRAESRTVRYDDHEFAVTAG